jgi:hypothetical protein
MWRRALGIEPSLNRQAQRPVLKTGARTSGHCPPKEPAQVHCTGADGYNSRRMRLPLALAALLAFVTAVATSVYALAPAPAPPPTQAPRPPQPVPTGTPTPAPGGWKLGTVSTRVDGETFVVSGTAENRGAPMAAVASVELFAAPNAPAGKGDGALRPSPVPQGSSASFEVRIAIEQIVRRFTVTLRPAINPRVTLAEVRGEFKDMQQFAAIASRQLSISIQTTDPTPGPKTLVAVVTNNSPIPVASATVTAEISVTCRVAGAPSRVLIAAAAPIPTPMPPIRTPGRNIQENWTGTATVPSIGARSSAQAPLQLSGGVCLFFTSWTVTTARIQDVRVGE